MLPSLESQASRNSSSISVQPEAESIGETVGLSGRLINVAEEERRHLARELHDDIGQRLSLLALNLDILSNEPNLEASVRAELERALAELKELATDVHNLSHRLHSTKLQHLRQGPRVVFGSRWTLRGGDVLCCLNKARKLLVRDLVLVDPETCDSCRVRRRLFRVVMIGSHLECATRNPDHVVVRRRLVDLDFGNCLALNGLHKDSSAQIGI